MRFRLGGTALQSPTPPRSGSGEPSHGTGLLVLTVALLLLASAACAQDNLCANAGFETAPEGRLAEWTITVPAAVALRTDGAHTGAQYLRVTDPDAKTGINVEGAAVPCRPGGQYRASAWFRTADKCQPGVYLNFYNDVGLRLFETHERAVGPTAGWVQVETAATAPRDAATVSVTLYAYIGDVGTFDADEVMMTVTGGAEPGSNGIPKAEVGSKALVDLGSRRELFVDDYLLDGLSGTAARRLQHPVRREIAFRQDQPWEGPTSAYFTVLAVDGKALIYYRGSGNEGTAYHETTCVVESTDGIHFTRPELGLFEWQGSKANNIVWMSAGTHNFTPFVDGNPACPPDQRFRALASMGKQAQLVPLVSPDGYHWRKLQEEPVITKGAFDSQNLAFWDPVRSEYVEFHRGFRDGVRDIMTSTSKDFVTWTEPEWLDYGDAPHEHLYTNAITPYFRAPHMYLGFPNRFVESRKKVPEHPGPGVNDALLMSSRDGLHFSRWEEGFIRPTLDWENWTDRNNYVAYGLYPLNEREIALYSTDHYRHPGACLVVNTLRTDGFVALEADFKGGEALTRPLTFTGQHLEINYATSAAGSVQVALCQENGEAYEGFALKDCELLYGNELAHVMAWKGGTDVSALAGKPVRLRFRLKDAQLFSLRFGD